MRCKGNNILKTSVWVIMGLAVITICLLFAHGAYSQTAKPVTSSKPNILIIWGDDIGWFNSSVYHRGIMGYRTPNIDRITHEGAMFTDWYGQQSCTAGRAAFITGRPSARDLPRSACRDLHSGYRKRM